MEMKTCAKLMMILIVLTACVTGCVKPRIVIVPPMEPIQLAEDVPGVKAWALVDGARVIGTVDLPAGAWVLTEDSPE